MISASVVHVEIIGLVGSPHRADVFGGGCEESPAQVAIGFGEALLQKSASTRAASSPPTPAPQTTTRSPSLLATTPLADSPAPG